MRYVCSIHFCTMSLARGVSELRHSMTSACNDASCSKDKKLKEIIASTADFQAWSCTEKVQMRSMSIIYIDITPRRRTQGPGEIDRATCIRFPFGASCADVDLVSMFRCLSGWIILNWTSQLAKCFFFLLASKKLIDYRLHVGRYSLYRDQRIHTDDRL